MHRRDGAAVGHAGNLYQVLPVGIFQPAGEQPWNAGNDFSLWRCIIRELDYNAWPFATDVLTVVTIDAALYDELFGMVAAINVERSIRPAVPFSAETVERHATPSPPKPLVPPCCGSRGGTARSCSPESLWMRRLSR